MKRTLFYTAILIAFTANAQVQSYRIISPNSIESKNYYFTSLLRHRVSRFLVGINFA